MGLLSRLQAPTPDMASTFAGNPQFQEQLNAIMAVKGPGMTPPTYGGQQAPMMPMQPQPPMQGGFEGNPLIRGAGIQRRMMGAY